MKKLYILLVALFLVNGAMTQDCLPEGITFTNQAQIDNFQINHPNCNIILGNVTISGNDITNLNGLSVLNSIGGNLFIESNPSLTGLSGLNSLVSIGGDLIIDDNSVIANLSGLNS